jgi:hypothetical protein
MQAGCCWPGIVINHLMDDPGFAPYVKDMQTQLGVCSKLGRKNYILYDYQSYKIMLFNTR